MCQPNAEPSLCRTPLPYGPSFLDFLWPMSLNKIWEPQWLSRPAKSAHPDLTNCLCSAQQGHGGLQRKENAIGIPSVLWCRGSEGTGVCTSNVLYNGEFCRSYIGVHWCSHWCTGKGRWRLELQPSPTTTLMPFATKQQTWVCLNTRGGSPEGTKPPWACPQERQWWLSLTRGGRQRTPRGPQDPDKQQDNLPLLPKTEIHSLGQQGSQSRV